MYKTYRLSEDAVVFDNGADEIRIRKGVWNYEEAVITLDGESPSIKECIRNITDILRSGSEVTPAKAAEDLLPGSSEFEAVAEIIRGLEQQSYITDVGKSAAEYFLNEYLPGGIREEEKLFLRPVLLFSDRNDACMEAEDVCRKISLPVHVMTDEEYRKIQQSSVCLRTDGYESSRDLEWLKQFLSPYACVIGAVSTLNVTFMRNLNRGLIECNMPLSMAMIDGPFTSVFVIRPPETGCFECMEQRLLARMEEHTLYEKYVRAGSAEERKIRNSLHMPLLSAIMQWAIFEGLSVSALGKSRLAGRVWNTYVPVMEMQMQDILRVPYCPACGTIARGDLMEMYTSAKKLVERVIDQIEIV